MEMFGNEFAKKRYLKYQGAVSWDQHSFYKGGAIERAYGPETVTGFRQPKALYRMQDGGVIVVGESLDRIKAAWTRYKEAKE